MIRGKHNDLFIIAIIIWLWYGMAPAAIYNIRDFGAAGNGVDADTGPIQEAIDAAGKQGGTVLVPAGVYLTGSLELRSHVELHLETGAILLGSTRISDYKSHKAALPSYNDLFLRYSLLYGENLENISITGGGTIDGQGSAFKVTTRQKPDRYKDRPFVIRFVACKDVRVEGIRLRNSAMWMQHYFACENLRIAGISVYNHCNKNNDMIDIDGCKDVIISDCFGDTDDDALTLKSTSGLITENVTVTNCILSSHCNAIKLGTESNGGFKNIVISDIIVKPSAHPTHIYGFLAGISGITLGMVDGGILDGVRISNVQIDGPRVPIFMRLGDRGRVYREDMPRPGTGVFRTVTISGITATGADSTGCSITGLPGHPVENITLSGIHIRFRGNGPALPADKPVPELPADYPESTMFGSLPAYGFYIRHGYNIRISDLDLICDIADPRPAVICSEVEDLEIGGLRLKKANDRNPVIVLDQIRRAVVSGAQIPKTDGPFAEVTGDSTDRVLITGNNLYGIPEIVRVGPEVDPAAVKEEGNYR
jgi:hypothetical protein